MFGQNRFGSPEQNANRPPTSSANDLSTGTFSTPPRMINSFSFVQPTPPQNNAPPRMPNFGQPLVFPTSTTSTFSGFSLSSAQQNQTPSTAAQAPIFGMPPFRISSPKSNVHLQTIPRFSTLPIFATESAQPSPPRLADTASSQQHLVSTTYLSGSSSGNRLFAPRFEIPATSSSTNIFGGATMTELPKYPPNHPKPSTTAVRMVTPVPATADSSSKDDAGGGRRQLRSSTKEYRSSRQIPRKPPGMDVQRWVASSVFSKALDTVRGSPYSKDNRQKDPRTRRPSDSTSGESVRASSAEIQNLTSLVCKGIPDDMNNKRVLMEHFAKFGIVSKIYCNPSKQYATVTFVDHASALAAKTSGAVLAPGVEPLLILWSKIVHPASSSRAQPSAASQHSSKALNVSPKKTYRDQSEVDEELKSMGGSGHLDEPKLLERPPTDTHLRAERMKADVSDTLLQKPSENVNTNTDNSIYQIPVYKAEERFKILDQRDKLLRSGSRRHQDLATARAPVGTCPDMCPEKERYWREESGQLHPYEAISASLSNSQQNWQVDHQRAVKEYTRSSADQEEPLRHELRPLPVLRLTMDYLICNIADKHENGNLAAEWYDFLWNRMRAIRKDIVQQHLCNAGSVQLVEQITRFHIHCSARLCEEDMNCFDQKINDENLTKCLQTLNEQYDDLAAMSSQMPCLNEPEFRAYDVFLKLNEGDVLRKVQLLRPEVRNSAEIRFALDVYYALNEQNYVRFFRLVRSPQAYYLTSCLLQRYFNQVRVRALHALTKAYCPPNRSGQFPISKLVDILAFEDDKEARDFLLYHGLQLDDIGGHVTLDRTTFSPPSTPMPLRRALKVIESKRISSVGQVLCGALLPSNPLSSYVPHSSFDRNGCLIRKMPGEVTVPDVRPADADVAEVSSQLAESSDAQFAAQVIIKAMVACVDDMITETVTPIIKQIVLEICDTVMTMKRVTFQVVDGIVATECVNLVRDVASETLKHAQREALEMKRRKEEEEKSRKERIQRLKNEIASENTEKIISEVLSSEVRDVASTELKEHLARLRQKSIETVSEKILQEFLENWTAQLLRNICEHTYQEEAEYRSRTLRRVARKLGFWRARAFFYKWLEMVQKRRRTRTTMQTFPSMCRLRRKSLTTQGLELQRGTIVSPLQTAVDRENVKRKLDAHVLSGRLRETVFHSSMYLTSLVLDYAPKRVGRIDCKLIVSCSAFPSKPFVEWLSAKFSAFPLLPHATGFERISRENGAVVVVVAFFGEMIETSNKLKGTTSVLFFTGHTENGVRADENEMWQTEYRRLAKLLQSKPRLPAIPLFVFCDSSVCCKSDDVTSFIAWKLQLQSFVDDQMISEFNVVTLGESLPEPHSTHALVDSIRWMSKRSHLVTDLKMDGLDSLVYKMIAEHFSRRVCKARVLLEEKQCLHGLPEILVVAFNDVIDHVTEIITLKELIEISWPAPELAELFSDLPPVNWNSLATFRRLSVLTKHFRLCSFPPEVEFCEDWNLFTRFIFDYVEQLASSQPNEKFILATKLQKIFDDFLNLTTLNRNVPKSRFILWTEIFNALIDYKLQLIPTDVRVVYDFKTTGQFIPSEEWRIITGSFVFTTNGKSLIYKRKQETADTDVRKRFAAKVQDKQRYDPFQVTSDSSELKAVCNELSRQLEIEKQRTADFDKFLMEALQT